MEGAGVACERAAPTGATHLERQVDVLPVGKEVLVESPRGDQRTAIERRRPPAWPSGGGGSDRNFSSFSPFR